MTSPKHQFLWLDLETTGLDPHAPGMTVLEWAAVLAEDDTGGSYAPVQEYTGVIGQTEDIVKQMDLRVVTMHWSNHLLQDCYASKDTLAEADDFLYELCCELAGSRKPRGITLAGNSVHFDLAWIRVFLPRLAGACSHRVHDISTLLRAAEIWCPGFQRDELDANGDKVQPAHRALPDVMASLRFARRVRDAMAVAP